MVFYLLFKNSSFAMLPNPVIFAEIDPCPINQLINLLVHEIVATF